MPPFEVFFKARHSCPFGRLSERFPSVRMFVWCNSIHEVIEMILPDRSQYGKIRKDLSAVVNIVDQTFDGESFCLITKKCNCTFENSIAVRMEAHNMLYLLPVSYEEGWEYYHAIAFRHSDFKRFMESAARMPAEIIITRKSALNSNIRALMPISIGGMFAELTQKQVNAVLSSYGMGYFRFPRKKNVKTIAESVKVPRTTFQEHLTKAENKLIAGLVPYLMLFQAKPEQRTMPERK